MSQHDEIYEAFKAAIEPLLRDDLPNRADAVEKLYLAVRDIARKQVDDRQKRLQRKTEARRNTNQ